MYHFYFHSWIVDNSVNFNRYFHVLSIDHKIIQQIGKKGVLSKVYNKINGDCFSRKASFVHQLSTTDIHSIFPEEMITIKTNCPLFAWVLGNKHNYEKFVQLGFLPNKPFNSSDISVHGFRLLSHILKNYFIFSKDVTGVVTKNRNAWKNRPSVGMHIRKGKSKEFRDKEFLYYSDVNGFVNCNLFKNLSNPVVYVASDSTEMKQKIMKSKRSFSVVTSHVHASHSSPTLLNQKSKVIGDVLIDVLTVASCDYVIGTWGSTLSILAAAFQGNIPYLVGKNQSCFLSNVIVYFSVFSKWYRIGLKRIE